MARYFCIDQMKQQRRNLEKQITPARIEKWLLEFSGNNFSNGTANNNLKTLRIMLTEAHRLGILQTNPATAVRPLASCTAMRLGEVIALQVEDLKEDYIHVQRSYDRVYGLKDTKTHDSRNIPLPERLPSTSGKLPMICILP